MNLFSQNNLIRVIASFSFIASLGAILLTGDFFYLFFTLIAILGLGSTYINNKLEFKIKKPNIFKHKLPLKGFAPLVKTVLLLIFVSLILAYLTIATNQKAAAAFNGFVESNFPAIYNIFNQGSEVNSQVSPTPIPTSTPYPTVAQQPTRGYVDPNPIITCNVHESCGGGTKQLRKNVCDNSTCCQLGDSWYFYEDKNKCLEDQKAQLPNNNNQQSGGTSNLVPVFISYFGYSLNCPSQNVSAVQGISAEIDKQLPTANELGSRCQDDFRKKDSCYINCVAQNNSDLDICKDNYHYTDSGFTECNNNAWDKYSSCIKSCPSPYDACKDAYAVVNNLANQIKNLCK